MDSGEEADEANQARTDVEEDVECGDSEQLQENDVLQEEKKDLHSGLNSEVRANSEIEYEALTVQDSNKILKELRDENQEIEVTESEALPADDGFRGMLLTAAMNSRREGDRSRPVSASGSDPEKQEQLYIESVKTQAFEKELDVVSIQSTAASSSSTFIEKSDSRLEEHGKISESVLPFQELDAEQSASEEETGKKFFTRKGLKQVEVMSQCSQTEWSWLQDWKMIQLKMGNKSDYAENRSNSGRSLRSLEDNTADEYLMQDRAVRRKKKSLGSYSGHSIKEMSPATNERRRFTSISGESNGRRASTQRHSLSHRGSSQRQNRCKTSMTYKSSASGLSSLPQTPRGDHDMFFQAPTVESGSSSSSETDSDYEIQHDPLLPSIGPPTILQYNKESENPPLVNDEPTEHSGESPEALLCTSLYSGPCMFCSEEILPFPTMEEVETYPPDQLYCCPRYEQFVRAELFHRSNDAAVVKDEMIDIKPHPPYGTKAARKEAKERAAERAREREMEKQKAAGSNTMNFYALTRQMKTITFSLASTKCMDEGWTLRPSSPEHSSELEQEDPFVIEINPHQLKRRAFLERFYKDNKRFLLFLPDGTGCCYYPSGNVAVVISLTEAGKFTYLVYEDSDDFDITHPGMLAVFEPTGYGTCYYKGGGVRMSLNPFGGVLLDSEGARKKKWLWHNTKTHVHAPPFQPITFCLSRHISLRCLAQSKIILTFNYHRYTARFNVGSKLKAVAKVNPPSVRDHYETHLAEIKQFINILIDRSQTTIRLPHYPRPDRIPLPLRFHKVKDSSKKRVQNLLPLNRPDTTTVTVN